MAGISGTITAQVLEKLVSLTDGVNVRVAAIQQADGTLQPTGIRTVLGRNLSADISEKTGHGMYPSLLVYCDKMSNSLKEKFRQFSGKTHIVIEVRHSQDGLESIEEQVDLYVDAVCALLDDSRGSWGAGAFYAGGYEVSFDPVARGGKNFLQRAKIGFDVEVSK